LEVLANWRAGVTRHKRCAVMIQEEGEKLGGAQQAGSFPASYKDITPLIDSDGQNLVAVVWQNSKVTGIQKKEKSFIKPTRREGKRSKVEQPRLRREQNVVR